MTTTPKQEVQAAILQLKEMVMNPRPTPLQMRMGATLCDHALEFLNKLSNARPRKPIRGAVKAGEWRGDPAL